MAKITALLAHGPGQPEGDVAHGLEMRLCLTPEARIDFAAYQADPLPWRTRRFWPDREDWAGELIRVDESWALRSQRGEDEPLWDFIPAIMRPGEYLTLRRPSGEELIYRIVQGEQE
jgi:hypothetical protein